MSEVTINTVCSIRNSLMYRGGKIWMQLVVQIKETRSET